MKFIQIKTVNNEREGELSCYYNYEFLISKVRVANSSDYKVNFSPTSRMGFGVKQKECNFIINDLGE